MMGPGFERRGPRFGDEEERMERRRMEEEMEYHDWFFPRPPMGPRPPFLPHMGPMMPVSVTAFMWLCGGRVWVETITTSYV